MSLPTFGQLLAEYMSRSGISDSELARSVGVRRQTIFRWKEGLVERPRAREDVLQCAKKLRLSDDERDRLLLAAGFPPEHLSATVLQPPSPAPALPAPAAASPQPALVADPASDQRDMAAEEALRTVPPALLVSALDSNAPVDSSSLDQPLPPGSSPLAPLSKPVDEPAAAVEALPLTDAPAKPPAAPLPPLLAGKQRWVLTAGVLLLALLAFLWARNGPFVTPPTPTPPPPATVILHPPPQTTPTPLPAAMIAEHGEILLLVAQFKGETLTERFNVADRVSEALTEQVTAAKFVSTTVTIWPEEITTVQDARTVLTTTNATMMIWGKYDSGRVRVNLETHDPNDSQKRDYNLTSTDELLTTINYTVPTEIRLVSLIALGRLLRNQGDYPAATAAFQQALALNPQDQNTKATLNFYLGHLAEQDRSLPGLNRALTYYSRAIELNHELYLAYYNRGTAQLNRYGLQPADEKLLLTTLNAAVADLSLVVKNRPGYVDAYYNRAFAYYERDEPGDMDAALTDLAYTIALKADYVDAYYLRGLVHIRAGKGEQWVADFQQVLKMKPDATSAISGLCWGYVLAQQPEAALPHCDEAVKHDKSGASHDSRAIAYAQLGRYAEAIADFRTYLATLNQAGSTMNYERYRGPLVEQWITQLEAGQNPFDEALLARLRHRDHFE
ncbi:MAG: XRE family transcriptional regulator [Caldilinea sp. CFX5]|nr:XRE family transcriptional regulator [Caldilinea sp. CFX5]